MHTRIDQINDFSSIKIKNHTEKEEYPHLEKVTNINAYFCKKIIRRLKELEIELEKQVEVIEMETDLDARKEAVGVYNKILKNIQDCIVRINRDLSKLDSPYFGKILFELNIKDRISQMPVYIGKFALVDQNTYKPLISDWRAPIANIYYENSGPTENLHYNTPSGVKSGNLLQKRQFNISEARFINIYDAKSGNVAADEFLLAQLNKRLGEKLQDIVATIQAQQNDIIRDKINRPIIIQGVAGSGKTTILLHRLAYLFYTYKEYIHPERSLIVGPNKMFLDYIADVLPSLGIDNVEANTYIFWAKNILGWNDKYTLDPSEPDLEIKEYKGSIQFLETVDSYFEEFESDLLENIPYTTKEIVKHRYYELKKTYPNIAMNERLTLALEYSFTQKQFREKRIEALSKKSDFEKEKKKEISKYFNRNTVPIEVYKNMFKKGYTTSKIAKYTLPTLTKKGKNHILRIEDIAPILYLHLKIYGTKEYEKEYVMVDEAQDLSVVQIATLLQISRKHNVTIAGDLAQSIIAPFYIKDWNQIIELFKKLNIEEYSFHQLNRCYRSTVEIIEYGNKIFRDRFPKSYKLPEAVLRHGEDIKTIVHDKTIDSLDENRVKELIDILKKEFAKGSVTCALICRNRKHTKDTYERLSKYEQYLGKEIVDFTLNDYKTGLLILPIEDAKGLEFDTVILLDVNREHYPDSELSTRLLYVAITRALHRLIIIENSNRSVLFEK